MVVAGILFEENRYFRKDFIIYALVEYVTSRTLREKQKIEKEKRVIKTRFFQSQSFDKIILWDYTSVTFMLLILYFTLFPTYFILSI